jgi:hypothetical protein
MRMCRFGPLARYRRNRRASRISAAAFSVNHAMNYAMLAGLAEP